MAFREGEGPVPRTLSPGAGDPGPGEAGELNREALAPSWPPSLGRLHTLRSGLRRPGVLPGKGGGSRGWQGVLHFRGGRARCLRRLGVMTGLGRALELRPPARRRRRPISLRKSGSSESSEATGGERSSLLVLLLLVLLKKRFES